MRMSRKFLLAFLLASHPLAAAPLHLQSSPDRFVEGDSYFKLRRQKAAALSALSFYRNLASREPLDKEALWRVAMACHYVGMHYEEPSQKTARFEEGKDSATRALEIDPECAPCHFWKAINMALLGQEIGAFKMIFSLKEILHHLEKVNEIDPAYAYGGSDRVVGLILAKLPGILGGSNSQARERFERAIKVAPEEPLNYLVLARLLEKMGDLEAAVNTTRLGLQQPVPAPERTESVEAVGELREFLAQLTAHS